MSRVGDWWNGRSGSGSALALRGPPLDPPLPMSGVSILDAIRGPYQTARRTTRAEQIKSYSGWVSACVNAIAVDVRGAEWEIGRVNKEEEFEAVEPPPILTQPNPQQGLADLLEVTSKHIDMVGEAFWYVLSAENGGAAFGWEVLPTQNIAGPTYAADGRLVSWEYQSERSGLISLASEDIVFTYVPHPAQPYRGASAVEMAALSHDMDTYAKAYGTSILQEGGLPVGIISVDAALTPEQSKVVAEGWRQNRAEGRSTVPVFGSGAQYVPIGMGLRDLEFLNLSRMNRDSILAIFGVPAGKLGLVEDVNRANSEGIELIYSRDTLRPRLLRIAASVNQTLLPRLGIDGLVFRFKNVVPADKQFQLTRANDGIAKGAITVNEWREQNEWEPLENGGDVFTIPSNVRLAEDHEQPPPAVQPPPPPAPERSVVVIGSLPGSPPPDPPASDASPPEADPAEAILEALGLMDLDELGELDIRRVLQSRGLLPGDLALSSRDRENAHYRKEVRLTRLESKALAAIRALLSRQQKAVVKAIKGLKHEPKIDKRMAHQPWIADVWQRAHEEAPALEQVIEIILQEDDVDEYLRRDLLDSIFKQQRRSTHRELVRLYMAAAEDGWDLFSKDVGREMVRFESAEARLRREAEKEATRTLDEIQATTRRSIAETVAVGVAAGLSVDLIATSVSRLYDDWKGPRARTIATTESAKALNAGAQGQGLAVKSRLGKAVRKTWVTTIDGLEREAHHDANGQRRAVDKPFDVGGEQLQRPLDPNGSASNVINCRCIPVYEVE